MKPSAEELAHRFIRNSLNPQMGFCCPSFRMIAKSTGLSRGTAERAVRALVANGYLAVISGGGGLGNANIYRLGKRGA